MIACLGVAGCYIVVVVIGTFVGIVCYGWGVHDERTRPKRGGDVTNLQRRRK